MRFKKTLKQIQEEALKYCHRSQFQKFSSAFYQAAQDRGILDQVCSHMKNLHFYWSNENIMKEAQKHKSRSEFKKASPSGYYTARKRNILENVCCHMVLPKTKRYLDSELQKKALLYNKRTEFQTKSKGAYLAAFRRGILDKICSHMDLSINISRPEKDLFDIIRNIYPSAKRIKDTEVKIKQKPYIKGFDIDIFVPELKRGIEFDGGYWHSFGGLKRSRNHWSDEDIRNYHQLKDDWFKTKEIVILHINEEEWIDNKQGCIDRCLEFLGVR